MPPIADSRTATGRVRFGGFEFDALQGSLTLNGEPVDLTGQPLEVLRMLLERPGQLVSRDELGHRLWPRATRIDTSRRLNTTVRTLRAALGDSAESARFIETERGRGYRFVAPLRHPIRFRRLAAGITLLLSVLASSSVDHAPVTLPPDAMADYVAAVAAYDAHGDVPAAVHANLRDVAARHPRHRPSASLLARLAVDAWRRDPTEARLADADRRIRAALDPVRPAPSMMNLLAELALYGRFDLQDAEHWLSRALGAEPDRLETHRNLAWLYLHKGDTRRALTHVERLLALAPLPAAVKADTGWLLLRLDRPELALTLCREMRATPNSLSCWHTAHERLGDYAGARSVAVALMHEFDADAQDTAMVAAAAPAAGYRDFLAWRARRFDDVSWFQRAQLHAAAGSTEAAAASLSRSYALREPDLVKLASTRELRILSASQVYHDTLRLLPSAARPDS